MKQNDTVMNLRIATELHDQLKALAKKKYMPVSVMVRLALMDYITQEAPSVLLNSTQVQSVGKPMSNREYKFIREQQMRDSASMPASPSQRVIDPNNLSEDDWL